MDWTSTCVRVCECHVKSRHGGPVSPGGERLARADRTPEDHQVMSCYMFASRYAKGFSISARASAISSLLSRRTLVSHDKRVGNTYPPSRL